MVMIAEKVIAETRDGPEWAVMQSINMLICTEGKERTLTEYDALLTAHGFRNVQCMRTHGPLDVVTAVKP
jgi:acetylserotonin N-methyltransferase